MKNKGSLDVIAYVMMSKIEPFKGSIPRLVGDFSGESSFLDFGVMGLENQGATCYLNSLLQALFHLPLLRRLIFEAPIEIERKSDLIVVGDVAPRSGGGGNVIVVGDSDMEDTPDPPKTVLSQEEALKGLADGSYCISERSRILDGFQRLFSALQCGKEAMSVIERENAAVSTKGLTSAFGWDKDEVLQQQDAMELFVKLVERLGKELGGDESPLGSAFNSLLHFHTVTTLSVPQRGITRIGAPDKQSSLSLYLSRMEKKKYSWTSSVHESSNVMDVDALDNGDEGGNPSKNSREEVIDNSLVGLLRKRFVTAKTLEDWEIAPGDRVNAEEREYLHSLPPILCVSINRFTFNPLTGMREKLCNPVEFPETLDMGEFFSPSRTAPAANSGGVEVDEEGGESCVLGENEIGEEHWMDMPVTTQATLETVKSAVASVGSYNKNKRKSAPLTEEGSHNSGKPMLYHLSSVLTHKGSAGSGHYYALVRPHFYGEGSSISGKAAKPCGEDSSAPYRSAGSRFSLADGGVGEAEFIVPSSTSEWVKNSFFDDGPFPSLALHQEAMRRMPGSVKGDAPPGTYNVGDWLDRERGEWGGWFKLNDAEVSPVSRGEAVEGNWGSGETADPTAYALIYVAHSALTQVCMADIPAAKGPVAASISVNNPMLSALQVACRSQFGTAAAASTAACNVEGEEPTVINSYYVDVSLPIPLTVINRITSSLKFLAAAREIRDMKEKEARTNSKLLLHVVTDLHLAANTFPILSELPCKRPHKAIRCEEEPTKIIMDCLSLEGSIPVEISFGEPLDKVQEAIGKALGLPPGSFRVFSTKHSAWGSLRPYELIPFSPGCPWACYCPPKESEFNEARLQPFPWLDEWSCGEEDIYGSAAQYTPGKSLPPVSVDEYFLGGSLLVCPEAHGKASDGFVRGKSRTAMLSAMKPGERRATEVWRGLDRLWDGWSALEASTRLPPPPPSNALFGALEVAAAASAVNGECSSTEMSSGDQEVKAKFPSWKPGPAEDSCDAMAHAALFVQLLPHPHLIAACSSAALLHPLPCIRVPLDGAMPQAEQPELTPSMLQAALSLHPILRILSPLAHSVLHNTAVTTYANCHNYAVQQTFRPARTGLNFLELDEKKTGKWETSTFAHCLTPLQLPELYGRINHELLPPEGGSFNSTPVLLFRLQRNKREGELVTFKGAFPPANCFQVGPCGYIGVIASHRLQTVGETLVLVARTVGLLPNSLDWVKLMPKKVIAAAEALQKENCPDGILLYVIGREMHTMDGLSPLDDLPSIILRWVLLRLPHFLRLSSWPNSRSSRSPTPQFTAKMLPWIFHHVKSNLVEKTGRDLEAVGRNLRGSTLWASYDNCDIEWWNKSDSVERWINNNVSASAMEIEVEEIENPSRMKRIIENSKEGFYKGLPTQWRDSPIEWGLSAEKYIPATISMLGWRKLLREEQELGSRSLCLHTALTFVAPSDISCPTWIRHGESQEKISLEVFLGELVSKLKKNIEAHSLLAVEEKSLTSFSTELKLGSRKRGITLDADDCSRAKVAVEKVCASFLSQIVLESFWGGSSGKPFTCPSPLFDMNIHAKLGSNKNDLCTTANVVFAMRLFTFVRICVARCLWLASYSLDSESVLPNLLRRLANSTANFSSPPPSLLPYVLSENCFQLWVGGRPLQSEKVSISHHAVNLTKINPFHRPPTILPFLPAWSPLSISLVLQDPHNGCLTNFISGETAETLTLQIHWAGLCSLVTSESNCPFPPRLVAPSTLLCSASRSDTLGDLFSKKLLNPLSSSTGELIMFDSGDSREPLPFHIRASLYRTVFRKTSSTTPPKQSSTLYQYFKKNLFPAPPSQPSPSPSLARSSVSCYAVADFPLSTSLEKVKELFDSLKLREPPVFHPEWEPPGVLPGAGQGNAEELVSMHILFEACPSCEIDFPAGGKTSSLSQILARGSGSSSSVPDTCGSLSRFLLVTPGVCTKNGATPVGRTIRVPVQPSSTFDEVVAYSKKRLGMPFGAIDTGALGLGSTPLAQVFESQFWCSAVEDVILVDDNQTRGITTHTPTFSVSSRNGIPSSALGLPVHDASQNPDLCIYQTPLEVGSGTKTFVNLFLPLSAEFSPFSDSNELWCPLKDATGGLMSVEVAGSGGHVNGLLPYSKVVETVLTSQVSTAAAMAKSLDDQLETVTTSTFSHIGGKFVKKGEVGIKL